MPTFLFLALVSIWITELKNIKNPFQKYFVKGILTVAVFFVSFEWWHRSISMRDTHYDFGCYVETRCLRGCSAIFKKENGELEEYIISFQDDFYYRDVKVGSCLYIKHYPVLWWSYVISVQKEHPNFYTNAAITD